MVTKPVTVYIVDLDSMHQYDAEFENIGPRYFGNEYKANKHYIMTLVGNLLVHFVFRKQYPHRPLPEYSFNENGKPFFEQYPDFQFNISDSKLRVVAAFDTEDVGADVEYLRTHRMELMQRFFSNAERHYVENQENDELRGRAFTMLWSMKEALVKCLGTGIAKDFTNYSVDVENELVSPADSGLMVSGTVVDGDCFVTLCRRGEKPAFDFHKVTMEEILDTLKLDKQ